MFYMLVVPDRTHTDRSLREDMNTQMDRQTETGRYIERKTDPINNFWAE